MPELKVTLHYFCGKCGRDVHRLSPECRKCGSRDVLPLVNTQRTSERATSAKA